MTNLKKTLANITGAIVDKPEEIVIVEKEDGDHVTLELSVAPDDMGMGIGKGGRIAKAIRMVIKAAAADCPKKVNVDIR